jgi:phage-related protein
VKDLVFVGNSDEDMRALGANARRGWLPALRCSVRERAFRLETDADGRTRVPGEIRVQVDRGALRVFYVATIGEVVYVLHCFLKTTQKTARADIELGRQRYKQMTALIREQEKP